MKNNLDQSGPFIGVGGMAVAAFLYGYTAVALPSWLHSLALPVLWLVLFVLTCRWFTRRPRACVLPTIVAIVVWFLVMVGLGPTA